MIAIAQHPRRSVFGAGRSVFLLIVLTAALAFGLMAMHALNTPTTHSEPAAMSMPDAGSPSDPHASSTDAGCADCGGHEAMLAMACVFVLLVASLLILLPRVGVSWGVTFGRAGPVLITGRISRSRPPSLLVLCISRT
ncbi:hypothetical protein GCM10022200_25820 [Microbacterium awajiense]|uniref:DUF2946 domain-containing protein n=1 Tax=Microbacterium awajiense TaxID=415214 RepID=A0ABP7AVD4_9MICO